MFSDLFLFLCFLLCVAFRCIDCCYVRIISTWQINSRSHSRWMEKLKWNSSGSSAVFICRHVERKWMIGAGILMHCNQREALGFKQTAALWTVKTVHHTDKLCTVHLHPLTRRVLYVVMFNNGGRARERVEVSPMYSSITGKITGLWTQQNG